MACVLTSCLAVVDEVVRTARKRYVTIPLTPFQQLLDVCSLNMVGSMIRICVRQSSTGELLESIHINQRLWLCTVLLMMVGQSVTFRGTLNTSGPKVYIVLSRLDQDPSLPAVEDVIHSAPRAAQLCLLLYRVG